MARQATLELIADATKLRSGLQAAEDQAAGTGSKLGSTFSNLAGSLAGLGVGAFLKDATQAAAEDQAAHEKLATSLRNNIGAWDDQIDSVEKWITKMQFAKGFSDTDLRGSMESLVGVTKNVGEAQNLAGVAMDLARAKGISLSDATGILAKAHEGNTKAIKAQFPEIGKLIKDNASADEIISTLTQSVKGQADTFAGTAAGKAEIFHQKMGELTETIGAKLLPVMATLADWLSKVIDFFSGLSPGVQTAIEVAGGLVIGLWALNSVIGTATAAAAAFGVTLELSLGPIALVVLAIAGIIAIGVLLITHWDAVKGAAAAVWNWISDHWPLLLAILTGPIGLAVKVIYDHFDGIVTFVKGLPGRITSAAAGMWDGIKEAFRSALNWVIDRWNGLEFKIPGFKIGPVGFDGFTLGVPDIPHFAAGGPIDGLGLVGENGPELFAGRGAIIPNNQLGGLAGGGPSEVHVHVYLDGQQITETVHQGLIAKQRSGNLGFEAA